jgi:AcrR family transcriptional regulator
MPASPRSASKKKARRQRAPLTRERIVSTALNLADTRGDFSMRALGQELGNDPMAVYRHFRDKEALLDAMVDAALGELEAPSHDARAPVERLREMCIQFRSALHEHPGVATRVSTTRPTLGPHTVALTEACLSLLREMGLDAHEATRSFLMLIRFITGVVVAEERVLADGSSEVRWLEELRAGYASVPPAEFPNVAAMAGEIANLGFDSDFDYGLDLVLEGLARRARDSPRQADGTPRQAG